jgi:hypothetical protein
MLVQDIDRIRTHYHEYWNRENRDRPIIAAYAPRERVAGPSWSSEVPLRDRWMDVEQVVRMARTRIERTEYLGEAFPAYCPDLGPDFLGAILGCDLEFGEATSWSHPIVKDWKIHPDLTFDPASPWWRKMVELTEAALMDSKGDYFVGVTDLHAGMDGIVSLRGPERVCMDLFDEPDEIVRRNWQVLDVFRKVFDGLEGLISSKQTGSTNWMGLLHPGREYVTSCDFSCLISEDDFETFVVPELLAELSFLDASIFHLDGPGALRHLDRLLRIPELDGIQWVPGAGQKPMREWMPVLRRIQDAGKLLQLNIEPEDLLPLCEGLRPEGVQLNCWFVNAAEAREALAEATARCRKRDR